MSQNFIPAFHFEPAENKLKPEWANKAIHYLYHNSYHRRLLEGKNLKEIDEYTAGNFDMTPFKKLFKSLKKKIEAQAKTNNLATTYDDKGLDWTQYAIIQSKINSAVAIIHKIPVEFSCTALDPLAARKKEEDLTFLKNKPEIEKQLQQVADMLQVGKVDIGTTRHSAIPYSSSPYGLDLNEPDELNVFINLLYNLGVEVSFETALQIFWEIKKVNLRVKLMETKDQFKYGVSVNQGYESAVTGLPDVEYVFPNNVSCPPSTLPDFSDNPFRFIETQVTAMELFNLFGDEIGKEGNLDTILNEKEKGYCACNGKTDSRGNVITVTADQWDTFKLNLVYAEVKSVDWIGISEKKNSKQGFKSITTDETKATKKLWGQNTYGFWWLKNTKHVFGIKRLGYAFRKEGLESYQNFSTNVFKSQERSCVENCIGENKKAQVADVKMQHALIKSLPAGKYIDLRFIRGALSGLKEDGNMYTIEQLVFLAMEENIIIGDTQGFEGKNDGQFKPFMDIAGGLKTEVEGYLRIMAEANRNIEIFSGINAQLTGQSADKEGLIGLEKLRMNASINALQYVTEAIQHQCQQLAYLFANHIKRAVEDGGEAKKFIVNLIGSQKAEIIDALEDLPLHTIGVKVTISQREEERAKYERSIYNLKVKGVITEVDEYMLDNVANPKDRYALLAIKEKQYIRRKEQEARDLREAQQKIVEQQGQNMVQAQNAATEGKIKVEYAKGDVQSKIISLAGQLNLNQKQTQALIDRQLQQDRQAGLVDKNIRTLQAKHNLSQQESLL